MNERAKRLMLTAAQALGSQKEAFQTSRRDGCRALDIIDDLTQNDYVILERQPYHTIQNPTSKYIYEVVDKTIEKAIGYFDLRDGSWHTEQDKAAYELSSFEKERSTSTSAGK